MEEIISKEELEELMKIEGEFMGLVMKNTADFVVQEKGEEGLKKLEETMKGFGYPIKYRKVRSMNPYPINLYAVTLVAVQRLFNWDDKKFQELGTFQFKAPITIRLFMRYFIPLEKMLKIAQDAWGKFYLVGNIKMTELDREKKQLIARIENFYPHRLHCQTFIGNIPAMIQIMIGKKTTCEETKCTHKGDAYHEFLLKW